MSAFVTVITVYYLSMCIRLCGNAEICPASVNVQMRGQTFNVQVCCIVITVILLFIGVTSLHFARKVYYGNVKG